MVNAQCTSFDQRKIQGMGLVEARKKLSHGDIRDGEDQKGRPSEERRCRRAKSRKVAKHCIFPLFCGSGGSKSRLAKAAGAETPGQMRNKTLHALVARSTF